jgi:Flp pilus assembly secretin CpaC
MIRWVLVALILSSKSVFAQTAAGPDTVLAKCLNKATEYAVEIKCGATLALEPEHVRLLTLDRSFASVIVGSEDVADVQIPDPQDNRTVLITAKSKSGKTNLMLLDAKNQPIFAAEIAVSAAVEPNHQPLPDRVYIHSQKKVSDYIPWACNEGHCLRLKEQYQTELTNKVIDPGQAQSSEETTTKNPDGTNSQTKTVTKRDVGS